MIIFHIELLIILSLNNLVSKRSYIVKIFIYIALLAVIFNSSFSVGQVLPAEQQQKLKSAISLYQNGNYTEAFQKFSELATAGVPVGIAMVGEMYALGRGVKVNPIEAYKWTKLGAEKGFGASQANLGGQYLNGEGVEKDVVNGYMWIDVAVNTLSRTKDVSLGQVIERRDKASKKLTPEQFKIATQYSQDCIKRKFKNCGNYRMQIDLIDKGK